jgi:ribosome-binding protein aMBF1 (putative translation factor)
MATKGPAALKAALKKRGLSLRRAAKLLGIDNHVFIYRCAVGRSIPSAPLAVRMEDELGIPVRSWA